MRLKFRGRFSVATACVLGALWLGSCSSSQQQDEDVAAEDSQGDQVASEGGQELNDGNAVDNATASQEGGETAAAEGQQQPSNTTEGDLKEIISEMNSNNAAAAGDPAALAQNGQQPAPAAEAPAEAAPAAEAAAPAPAAAPAAEAAPAPAVAPAGLPEMGSKMAYVVEHGDTLGKIAQKVYGNSARWRDISNLSSLSNPSRIYPGDVVYYSLDEASVAFAKANESVQRSQETVQQGDTLAKIAKRVYGTSRSWKHIWRQNDNIDNPDKLTAGTTVYYVQKGALSAELMKIKTELKLAQDKLLKAKNISVKTDKTSNDFVLNNVATCVHTHC